MLCRRGRLDGETWSGTAAAHHHRRDGTVGARGRRRGPRGHPTLPRRTGVADAVVLLTEAGAAGPGPRKPGVRGPCRARAGTGPPFRSRPPVRPPRDPLGPLNLRGAYGRQNRVSALSGNRRTHPCTGESGMPLLSPAAALPRRRSDPSDTGTGGQQGEHGGGRPRDRGRPSAGQGATAGQAGPAVSHSGGRAGPAGRCGRSEGGRPGRAGRGQPAAGGGSRAGGSRSPAAIWASTTS